MSLTRGTRLGPYEITGQLGTGGMGEVYRAVDTRLDRAVAIKVLPKHLEADPERRDRFEREARAASSLNHPHICTLHDVGLEDETHYIVMELVEGETLQSRISSAGLTVPQALDLGVQIAGGLAHAHSRGLTHRDIKSANIMVTPEGRVKILDFGLASLAPTAEAGAAPTRLTTTGAALGTPAYMAPEVIRGATPDARSDVWALGIVLYEVLTGGLPFIEPTAYALTSSILEKPVPPLPGSIPGPVQAVVLKCLAKQPGERYQSAGEARAALEASGSTTSVEVFPAPKRGLRAVGGIVVAALAVLAVVLGVGLLGDEPAGGGPEIRSLAVLPFANISGDPDQEYFVDGMTDALIGELAKLADLKVIAWNSVMGYKDRTKSIPEIAADLDVDGIVEGTAVSSEGRVRLSARLIHAGTEESLWAESYERDLRNVLALQSEISRTIGNQLQAVLTPQAAARLSAPETVDPDAYQLALEGWYYAKRLDQESLERGIRFFDDAIARDPTLASAWAGNAFAWANLSSLYIPPLEAMPRAKEAALRAIELDPGLPEAHTWLGYIHLYFDWDWTAAERELSVALELNPNSSEAHLAYSGYLMSQGNIDEAMVHVIHARELDPLSIMSYASANGSQWALLMAGRHAESIQEGRRALELDPNFSWARAHLGLALVADGRLTEGLVQLEEATRLEDTPMLRAFLSYGYAQAGMESEARRLLRQVEEISLQRYTCAYEIAATHVALDDADAAIQWLNKAYDDRADCIPILNVDPRLDPLRSDPRFQELVDRVGFDSPTAALVGPSNAGVRRFSAS